LPVGYPLLKPYQGGVAFSFDILRSVAAVPKWTKVALASEGGVFLCAAPTRALDLSAEGGCTLLYGSDSLRLEGVSRVRAPQGQLWAVHGEGRVAVYDGKNWRTTSDLAPWQGTDTVAGRLIVEQNGIKIGELNFSMSNDAWGIGSRPLEGIIEIAYHPEAKFVWLCSRDHGVFKLRLAQLAGSAATSRR
jgi:hypothetical protein